MIRVLKNARILLFLFKKSNHIFTVWQHLILMVYNDICKLLKKTTAPEDKEWVEKMVGPFEEVIEPNDEYVDVEYLSRDDELVFAAAHELYHMKAYLYGIRLIRKSKQKAISEEKGNEIMSEKRADLYAIRKQKEWRKFRNQPICPKA